MGRRAAVAVLVAVVLIVLQPLATEAAVERLYYVDAVAGKYYAINTNGEPYRAFYIENGQVIYVTTYWWDANQSYIIFQAPKDIRIYLRPEPSLELSVFYSKQLFQDYIGKVFVLDGYSVETQLTIVDGDYSYKFDIALATNNNTWVSHGISSIFYAPGELTLRLMLHTSCDSYSIDIGAIEFANRYIRHYIANGYWCDISYTVYKKNANGDVFAEPGVPLEPPEGYTFSKGYSYSKSFSNGETGFAAIRILAWTSQSGYWLDHVIIFAKLSPVRIHAVTLSKNELAERGIIVYDALWELPYESLLVSGSEGSYYLWSANITISFSQPVEKGSIVIPSSGLELERPAIYIPELGMWLPAVYRDGLLIAPAPGVNVSALGAELVANYPYAYSLIAPEIAKIADPAELASLIPIANGTISSTEGNATLLLPPGAVLIWDGTFNVSHTNAEIHTITVNNKSYTLVYATATDSRVTVYFTGSGWLVRNTRPILADYNVTIGGFALKEYPLSSIDVALSGPEITGSWAYRIPVYITLSFLPQSLTDTGYLFRLELPIGQWIRAGLLSPALEDLLIVDSSMQPLPFAIVRNDGETAVVYVRYTRPLLSQSLVIYVLLQNKQLWGSGKTFSSLSAFDRINPAEGVDDLGWHYGFSYMYYNMWLFIGNASIAAGPTTFDFAAWKPSDGLIWEQHGSLITKNITVSSASGDEILVVFSRGFQDALVYVDGSPWYSIPLASFNKTSPAYYVKWKNALAVYAGKMIPYSYSLGQLVGSLERPAKIVVEQPGIKQEPRASMWDVLWAMAPLVLLALVFRLMQSPPGVR